MNELLQERRGNVLWLTINRPAQRNAITPPVMDAMARAIGEAGADRSLCAIVVTGGGDRAFCAGADLGGETFRFDYAEPTLPFANLLRVAHASKVPLVARVNGACMAGGMGLLAMCDLAVASSKARLGLPEVKVGVFPMQVIALLQRMISQRDLYELCLTGEPIDAQQALQMRLVNYVEPPENLDQKLDWLIARLADKSPAAIRRGRFAMRQVESMSFPEAIAFMEGQIGLTALTDDAAEGMSAFREKRPPQWTGR